MKSIKCTAATTKLEGTRMKSSLCHSLLSRETMRGKSEEVSPPTIRKFRMVGHKSNRTPNQQSTLDAEWGTVANARYLLSSIGSITPNASLLGNNVYNIFHCGRVKPPAPGRAGAGSLLAARAWPPRHADHRDLVAAIHPIELCIIDGIRCRAEKGRGSGHRG